MAAGVKAVHLKEKAISAPSTPRRVLLSHGRQTTADSPNGDIPVAQEKPAPNYLKPTMSSCHETSCTYPKSQQQHAEDSTAAAGARKRLVSIKSMEKPASPLSPLHPKGRTSRTDFSLKDTLSPKIVPEKASKAPTIGKTLTKAKSLPKSMPKRREANGTPSTTSAIKPEQEEKVLYVDIGVQGHAARHCSKSPKSDTEGKHCTSSEESDTGKPRAPPGKVSKKVCGNKGAPKKLKFQPGREQKGDGKEAVGERLKFKQSEKRVVDAGEGKAEQENVVLKRQEVKAKDAPPAYNDVIEETATKLAARGSKVQALVGAFESVISLQEPETQPIQQQEEVAVKVGRTSQPPKLKPAKEVKFGKDGAERGQPGRVKPGEEVKVGEKGAGKAQPDEQQQHPEEEVKVGGKGAGKAQPGEQQQQPEEEVKVGGKGAGKAQPSEQQQQPEEEVKVGGKGAGKAQPGEQQQQPEEEVKSEESGDDESKGGQWGQESPQKEMKGDDESGGEETTGGQMGQESQHTETEAKESEGEEGDRVDRDI